MIKDQENYIEHEVRIRLLEKIAEGIESRFTKFEDKIDSHFKWTLGTILMLIVAVLSFMMTVYLK
jgi:hypothetical protein